MAFATGSFGFVEFISKQTFLSVHIDKKLAVQKITPQIHQVVLSYIQPRWKKKNMRMCVKMIWIIMMNVFIVAAGAGGDRWLMKTIMRMVLFFLFVAVAERNMGAVFAAGIVFTAAWAALSLFEAETKKKRHANKVRQCRVRKDINRTIQIEQ